MNLSYKLGGVSLDYRDIYQKNFSYVEGISFFFFKDFPERIMLESASVNALDNNQLVKEKTG